MAQDLRGKLVVLVGGGGFLGRYVAQELLSRGARLLPDAGVWPRVVAAEDTDVAGELRFGAPAVAAAPGLAVTKPVCLRAIYSVCTAVMPKTTS